jgi:hypothetical protein
VRRAADPADHLYSATRDLAAASQPLKENRCPATLD